MHCDISYSNILFREPETDNDVGLRAGIIIDFEYAARMSEEYSKSPGLRTVCVLFSPFILHG
jgi:serine/threonine protein kinase